MSKCSPECGEECDDGCIVANTPEVTGLVERLAAFCKLADAAAHQPAVFLKPNHGTIDDLREAIAALSTPSSKEVETYMRELRSARYDKDNFPRMDRERAVSVILAEKTADLLQRLDRERQGADIQAQYWNDRCADTMDRLDLVKRQRDEATGTLSGLSITATQPVRKVCRAALKRIRAMGPEK